MSLIVRNSSKFLLQNTQKRKTHVSSCRDVFRPSKSCSSLKVDREPAEASSNHPSSAAWLQAFYVDGAISRNTPLSRTSHAAAHQSKAQQQVHRQPGDSPSRLELMLRLKHGATIPSSGAAMLGGPHQLPLGLLWHVPNGQNRGLNPAFPEEPSSHSCDSDDLTKSPLSSSSSKSLDCHTSDSGLNFLTGTSSNIKPNVASTSPMSDPLGIRSSHVVQCSKVDMDTILSCQSAKGDDSTPPPPERPHQPSQEQLREVEFHIQDKLPKFFHETHQYNIYVVDIEFHNNIAAKPYKTKGLLPYVWALTKLRMFAHFNYVKVDMKILKTTIDEDLGIVQVRWQVIGMPQSMAVKFWKLLKDKNQLVIDGFSTVSVNTDGKVYKHVADNVMPDQERKRRNMSLLARIRQRLRLRPVAGLNVTAKK